MSKKYLGSLGEKIALKYYQQKGFILLKKNYLTRVGELDLILKKNKLFYGVEVKTRTSHQYGFAEETIDTNKIMKMKKACYSFSTTADWRLEIIIIYLQNKQAKIKIFPINDC
ncbi:MAG: YraN family protein [Patescibacteria group bacterium]|jgi:putative endonuclease